VTLECVVETVDAAVAAERAGANRLELCVRLEAGGVTPPDALIAAVLDRVSIPVFAMIRPRAGNFLFTAPEFSEAERQAREARARGAHGIVTGMLHQDGRVDVERTRIIVEAAGDLPVTFHRAFDEVPDQSEALETIIAAGARRVLTSGGAATALDGVDRIAALVRQGGGRMTVLAGGGVRADNVRALIARSGVTEVHARFEDAAATRALAGLLYSSPDD
jgi:copper homeostasis protein